MRNKDLLWFAAAAGAIAVASALQKRNRYSFRDKVVFIAGGSRGLGLVLARQAAQEGAKVAICARDSEELDLAANQLEQFGTPVLALPCDLTVQEQVEATVHEIQSRLGPIDVLVNTAGTITVGPVDMMTLDDYEDAMRVNFWAPLYAIQAVVPQMRASRAGRIVNITSIGGKISVPHLVPYSASKFAMVGLSRGLRAELAKDGIVVTTVCPGLMRTGSPRNADFKGHHDAEYTLFKLSDSLPVTSMSAERAASQVLDACRRGDAEVVLGIQAKAAATFDALFPGMTAGLLSWINRRLPGSTESDEIVKGRDARELTPHWMTSLTNSAAGRNNECVR